MRILLFSDSHGRTHNMIRAVCKNKNIDMIIHLGDVVRDAIKIAEDYPGIKVEFVAGNNDWSREYPTEKILELEGGKIFITHGHHYNVKNDYRRIAQRGNSLGVDAVFFGHTHRSEEFFSDGMLLLNPGSIGLPPNGTNPAYCLVEITGNKIITRFPGL